MNTAPTRDTIKRSLVGAPVPVNVSATNNVSTHTDNQQPTPITNPQSSIVIPNSVSPKSENHPNLSSENPTLSPQPLVPSETIHQSRITSLKEKIAQRVFASAALTSILCVALVCVFLIINAVPAIQTIGLWDFLTGTKWLPDQDQYGILPMIVGSFYVTGGAILIGVPIGVFAAVYLAYFCPSAIKRLIQPVITIASGVPSIIYGFFGLVVIVPWVQELFDTSGKGIITASILLAMMILPIVISVAQTSIEAVPQDYYEAALAVGASKERAVFWIILPAAKAGILAGIILGIGRAIGETMAVVMVIGNQAVMPANIFMGVRTLTANIVLEMGYAVDLHRDALIATALVLFVFILIINFLFSFIQNKSRSYQ
ncbi:MAG: phosphate ABC transporter permease subunit PstC [Bifidobacteriaceae bacterium]|jgi:phosphate transport system permease protein|nr:phosphate ABC transporter permease subunit PstC [Bifidobacteriaceae bacterium]